MAFNYWKLMDRVAVAVRSGNENYRGFTGYVVEAGDEDALEKAKDWARERVWDREKREYVDVLEPSVHEFANEGFTVKILDSAGGSSQGGRLSFWSCEVEKDGVKFVVGVNDAVLADLIRNSTIKNGVVQEKVMFARKAGQPGFIHEGMESYQEAVKDMQHKAEMKSAKKTSKWEIGGVYKTVTLTSVCLGEVLDTMEEYQEQTNTGWYGRTQTKLRKREKPVKTLCWIDISRWLDEEDPKSFTKFLKEKVDREYFYVNTGKPPARAKTEQFEVTEEDLKLIDKILANKTEYMSYDDNKTKGRYKRVV